VCVHHVTSCSTGRLHGSCCAVVVDQEQQEEEEEEEEIEKHVASISHHFQVICKVYTVVY
jgi:hypothetical protein